MHLWKDSGAETALEGKSVGEWRLCLGVDHEFVKYLELEWLGASFAGASRE